MGTTTANEETHTDPFMDTEGFLAETQPRRRGAVAMNSHRWEKLIIISQTLTDRVWSGNTQHVQTQTEIATSGLCRQSDAALVWVYNGPILVQYFKHGTTAASYTIILKLKLKLVICNKCRGLLSEVVLHMKMRICILQQLLLNQWGSWDLNFPHIPIQSTHTVPPNYHMSGL